MTWPTYVSHKRVQAAKVIEVDGYKVTTDDGATIRRPASIARYTPIVGDYVMRYEDDGHLEFSPAKTFIESYTLDDTGVLHSGDNQAMKAAGDPTADHAYGGVTDPHARNAGDELTTESKL